MIQQPNPTKAYHACRTHVSRGMLADLHQRPRLFEGRYITGTIERPKVTPAMKLGTMIHALALEGREIAICPPAEHLTPSGNLSEKKATLAWVEEVERGGYIVASHDTVNTVKRASEAVVSHLKASGIDPADCIVEKPIYWERDDGLSCRALPDLIVPGRGCIDLKTTSDISDHGINTSCFGEFAYWLQPPHYLEGIKAEHGWDLPFVFLFVETSEPYGIREYRLSDDDLQWAKDRREQLIADLNRRTETGDWSDPEEGGICELKRPKWV